MTDYSTTFFEKKKKREKREKRCEKERAISLLFFLFQFDRLYRSVTIESTSRRIAENYWKARPKSVAIPFINHTAKTRYFVHDRVAIRVVTFYLRVRLEYLFLARQQGVEIFRRKESLSIEEWRKVTIRDEKREREGEKRERKIEDSKGGNKGI